MKLLLLLGLVPAVLNAFDARVFDNPRPWRLVSRQDGLTLEARPVAGSHFYEYRVSTSSDLPVSSLCHHVFEWGTGEKGVTEATTRALLERLPGERVVYDQIERPLVSKRDYAITVRRAVDANGTCRIRFWSSNELAPPKLPGWVRIDQLFGSWTFEARSNGATSVVYTLFADPGGAVPPPLVHPSHRQSALDSVRRALEATRVAVQAQAQRLPR